MSRYSSFRHVCQTIFFFCLIFFPLCIHGQQDGNHKRFDSSIFLKSKPPAAASANDNSQGQANDDDAETLVKVIVGFSSPHAKAKFENEVLLLRQTEIRLRSSSAPTTTTIKNLVPFKRTNAVAMTLTLGELKRLQEKENNAIEYLYPDYDVQLYQDHTLNEPQQVPYGILDVWQAETLEDLLSDIPLPPDNDNADEDCFRVCVVDTGLHINHQDIPFHLTSSRINGAEFGIPPGQFWHNPDPINFNSTHGTHVTGIMFASGLNDEGVVGVIPNPQGMCLSIARIFPDGLATSSVSAIYQAVDWCADQGSKIINMSLGFSIINTTNPSDTSVTDPVGEALYASLYEKEGILVVAAAGNAGDNRKSYPASHSHVLSVAAVDASMQQTSFSQFNDAVDLAAPGEMILSTHGLVLTMTAQTNDNVVVLQPEYLQLSRVVNRTDTTIVRTDLEWVDCDSGFEVCPDAQGKACVIQRGRTLFSEKTVNCQRGGGVLAFIYNNAPGAFAGSLGLDNFEQVTIPVLALTREQGLELLSTSSEHDNDNNNNNNSLQSGTLSVRYDQYGYLELSGTSMASPHVAGVAAKIWAARPACTNAQIEEALLTTALDLGAPQRDDRYGYGLVQGLDACQYLLDLPEPCGLLPLPSGAPSEAPTESPSSMPSKRPSILPSASPSSHPTESQSPTKTPIPATTTPSTIPATLISTPESSAALFQPPLSVVWAFGIVTIAVYL